jgi:hypothetical protein
MRPDFVIAFNGSSLTPDTGNISDYFAVCTIGVCGEPQLAFAGKAGNYEIIDPNDPLKRNRWGDYSWTTVDPTNPDIFWLFQEYPAEPIGGQSRWATVITEITTTAVVVPEISATSANAAITLLLSALALASERRRRKNISSHTEA